MTDFLPYVVAGITTGALYGLAATGLVLTYKTSGLFNFAQGALAAACAYAFHELREVRGLPWPVALGISVLLFAPALGLAIEPIARRLYRADTATKIVATIGLLVLIQGTAHHLYGASPLPFEPFVSTDTFAVADVRVGYDQLTIVLTSIACLAGLFAFFRLTALGLELRAVVDNPELLDLTGRNPTRVRRCAWAIGSSFAGLSGILLSTVLGLDMTFLTLLTVQAFGAAAVGRFRNLVVTYVAAVAIGIVGEVVKKYVPDHEFLAGIPSSLPFIVLFGVLLLSPAGRFREAEPRRRPYQARRLPVAAALPLGVAAATVVAFVPDLVGTRIAVYTNGAIYVVLFVSIALLVQLSGQVSLCQLSFAALGATTFSHLTVGAGLPWGVAALAAVLVVMPVGALLSIPAIRLSSLYLALATFGFAIVVQQLVFPTGAMFGGRRQRFAERPDILGLGGERGYFYLCALAAAGAIVIAIVADRTRLGRLLRGLADSPVALATHGTQVNVTRVLAFSLSSALAALAGVLLICLTGSADATGTTFNFFQSLFLLVILAVCGRSLVVAPVVAAFVFAVAPSYSTDPDVGFTQQILAGVLALGVTTLGPAVSAFLRTAAPACAWRRRTSPVADRRRGRLALRTPS